MRCFRRCEGEQSEGWEEDHDVAEEVVLYPAAKRIGGDILCQKAIEETVNLEKMLYQLDQEYGHNIAKLDFEPRLKQFQTLLMQHLQMEESRLLPELEKSLKPQDVISLNDWYVSVRDMAPTRPHPDSPTGRFGNLATAPLLGFLDSIRDLGKTFSS